MNSKVIIRPLAILAALLTLGTLGAQMNPDISGKAAGDSSALVRSIGQAEFAARDKVVADIEAYLRDSQGKVDALKQQGGSLGAEAGEKFKAALAEIETRQQALEQSIDTAKQADETTWASARARLGANLSAHAGAVADAEKAAGGGGR